MGRAARRSSKVRLLGSKGPSPPLPSVLVNRAVNADPSLPQALMGVTRTSYSFPGSRFHTSCLRSAGIGRL